MALKIDTSRRSANYSAGRPKGKPNFIVIHHWGIDGQKFDNVVRYLCRANGNTSAHYVVEAGRVAEIVSPDNRAWHAGAKGNPRGVGIECRPEMSAGDLETVAQLIAHLWKRYGYMRVYQHKDFMSTSCAGRWGSRLAWLEMRAEEIKSGAAGLLAVDGVAGPNTVRALQGWLGTTKDGVISSQPLGVRDSWPALTAVETSSKPLGSLAVRQLQTRLAQDNPGAADGLLGPKTAAALQRFLNRELGAALAVDGVAGPLTIKALQRFLNTPK